MIQDAALLTALVEGSVWARTYRDNTVKHAVVLFVTNTSLSERAQEQHPPQVVYLTETQKIISMSVEEFVKSRTYVTINQDLELVLQTLPGLAFPEEDEPEEDFDNVELPPDAADVEDATILSEGGVTDEGQPDVFKPYIHHDGDALLSDNFVSYTEIVSSAGKMQHTLRFRLDGISLEDLHARFAVPEASFTVIFNDGTDEPSSVELQSWTQLATTLEVRGAVAYGCVNLIADFAEEVSEEMVQNFVNFVEGKPVEKEEVPLVVETTNVIQPEVQIVD